MLLPFLPWIWSGKMRNPIFKHAIREIIHRKGISVSISLLLAIFVSLIASFFRVSMNVDTVYHKALTECKVEDAGLTLRSSDREKEVYEILSKSFQTEDHSYHVLKGDQLTVNAFRRPKEMNLPGLFEGRYPSRRGEITLDRLTMKARKLHIGSKILLSGREYTITGMVSLPDYSVLLKNPSDLLMDYVNFSVAILSDEEMDTDAPGRLQPYISMRFRDEKLPLDERYSILKKVGIQLLTKGIIPEDLRLAEQNPRISYVGDDMKGDRPMLFFFSVMTLLLLGLLLITINKRRIEEECAVIGTLRAHGIRRRELVGVYLLMPFVLCIVGILLGFVIERLFISKGLIQMYYGSFSLFPYKESFHFFPYLLGIVLPMLMVTGSCFLFLLHALRLTPLRFLRKDLKRRKPHVFHGKSSKRPLPSALRLRLIRSNPGSWILLFLGILFSTSMILAAFLLKPSIDSYSEIMDKQLLAKEVIYLKIPTDRLPGEWKSVRVQSFETKNPLSGREMGLVCYGRKENEGKGFTISEGLQRKLMLHVGDTLKFREKYTNQDFERRIDAVDRGDFAIRCFMGLREMNEMLGEKAGTVNAILADSYPENLPKEIVYSVEKKEDMKGAMDTMFRVFEKMIPLVLGIGISVFLIVLSVLTRGILDKNKNAIAFLKIMGYTDREINSVYIRTNTILTMLFLIIGIGFFYFIKEPLFLLFLAEYGAYVAPVLPLPFVVLTFILGMAAYSLVVIGLKRRLKRMDPSIILKEENT